MFNKLLKWTLPLLVLALAIAGGRYIVSQRPDAPQFTPPQVPVSIDAIRVAPQDYRVVVHSEGTVEPRTESTLIPQVSGQIVAISPTFREGGFFEAGDILVTLDPRDYELAIASAEAQVAQAQSALEQELAQAKVVEGDWRMLGKEAPELGLRKPQIAAARATLLSAESQLERARFDLERTRIRAPYDGQVLEKNVDVGQFVSTGTLLARVYATDYVEIRLPLTDRQLEFVDLPERFRGETAQRGTAGPEVVVKADIGRQLWQWSGRVVRAEGAIDTSTRQLFVVAQVDDPYERVADGQPPLRIGQFVEVEIQGRTLADAFVLPRGAVRDSGDVLIVDADSRLERRPVSVAWTDGEYAIVTRGLEAGDVINVTPLAVAASGTLVAATIDGVPPAPRRRPDVDQVAEGRSQ
ncbi:efflux RND transporter periplasmic adaptor subunit [Wenzhouxiangella sp. XN24]|uniref:efflux RND transporter periplasmic adaptor subunit n=1 Tax=Wenzhouxiangella sp. XN24 TaxID=2713569 RepID=UPI0013EBE69E|nr:efflux RND transporter periplasmic adaptor subunit [Wenzhouxiangella sp. XN24]NGX17401.1 efflux RND transporter periplasmic adaptor subunit [Wenzhouxiangella sp. XN24]